MQILLRRFRLLVAGGSFFILIWLACMRVVFRFEIISPQRAINTDTEVKAVVFTTKSDELFLTPSSSATHNNSIVALKAEEEANRSQNTEVELACRRLTSPYDLDEARDFCRPFLDPVAAAAAKYEGTTDKNQTADKNQPKRRRTRMTVDDYVTCASDCTRFRTVLGYANMNDHVIDDEREFPLAFGLLTYESPEQTERLLRLIYRPHNVYCLHADAKAGNEMHRLAEVLSTCLPNVIVAKPAVKVFWGKVSIVYAELLCIKTLLHFDARWRYYVNVVGREFPLRTNRELVKILRAYNGSNDVDGSRKKEYYTEWFQYSWITHEFRGAVKPPPPHGFVITKGYTHMAATRAFVEYALNNPVAQDLLHWMSDIKVPDEHFFQTLNHSPQHNIPGSYRDDPDTKTSMVRLKRWQWTFVGNESCHGDILRWICNIGLGDLQWVVQSKHFFVNKIRLDLQPDAFNCLEVWIKERLRHERLVVQSDGQIRPSQLPPPYNYQFDIAFYESQPFVSNHV